MADSVYDISKELPNDERFGVAKESLAEAETQLLFCLRRKWIDETEIQKTLSLCEEISRMLTATQQTLKQKVEKAS